MQSISEEPEITEIMNSRLILYHFEGCPYCQRVRNYLHARNIVVEAKDIHADSNARQALVAVGGKAQVPCLAIEGQALYESADIIQWFETHYPA